MTARAPDDPAVTPPAHGDEAVTPPTAVPSQAGAVPPPGALPSARGAEGLQDLAREAFAGLLGAATARRGARVFHPRGQSYRCRLVATGGSWGAALLDTPVTHDGLVRLSRGAGLPEPLPDVDGLALRLPGLGRGGSPLDILINSAWRFVFAPSVLAGTWSCILPFRTGSGRLVLLGARPQPGGFELLAAAPLGAWQPWGRLELGAPFDGETLTFAPTVGADDLVPVELFRTLRARSYSSSQAARAHLDPAALLLRPPGQPPGPVRA